VILAAAGKSERFKDPNYKKPFAVLKRKAIWLHSADLFLKRTDVKQLIIVISAGDKEDFLSRFGPNLAVMGIEIAIGGQQRADSVQNALEKVDSAIEYVAIHDAARPCLHADLVDSVFAAAVKHGAAIPAIPVYSTLKRSRDGQQVDSTEDRTGLFLAQTPQVFRRTLIQELYANRGDFNPTDEAQLAEMAGHTVAMVKGSPLNIKVTTKADLRLANACLDSMPATKFDAPLHPFADDNLWR
jgi:2-C-methyl-D-erythritol 4-phosphate cytidylyltransferase